MAILSDSTFIVTQADGNRAVFSVQPQHLNDIPGTTLAERVLKHGRTLAVERNGVWHNGVEEITCLRTIALLERCPEA